MNERKEIRFIDLFSGIGGFRRGLELSGGYRCVWSCDNNKYANQIYTAKFGEANHYSVNIRKVRSSSIPDHDLLCAGFPCQTFSNAGDRQGFKDPRGTLFFEIARIARHKQPRLLLLENVKGLLSHDEGETFKTILWELGRLGYWVEWQVLDSLWFGVPQKRERIFIIGHLGGEPTRTMLPIRETGQLDFRKAQRSQKQHLNCIDANFYKGPDKHGQRTVIAIGHTHGHFKQEARRFYPQKHLRTIVAQGGNQRNIILEMLEKGTRLRYPTTLECERAQGFPDGWTEGVTNTQRYKSLGNAVTVNVIDFIGKRIKESLP